MAGQPPPDRSSSAAPGDGAPSNANFRVFLGEREVGFLQVSRLQLDVAIAAAVKSPEPPTLVLRRAMGRSRELFEWADGEANQVHDRRQVTLQQLDATGQAVVNTFVLTNCRPTRWAGPALDASDDGVPLEEIEIAYDRLVWR